MQDAAAINEVDLECELDEIIAGLRDAQEEYPREAIAAARCHRNNIVPRLIAAIDRDVDEVRATGKVTGSAGFYAIYLLGEFQAKESLPSIFRALTCGKDEVDTLFADAIFEDFPFLLADLIDDISAADRLIADVTLDWTVRNLGMQVYTQFVALERMSRVDAVERLRGHLRSMIAQRDQEDGESLTWLIYELTKLAGIEALEEIREASRLDLIDESVMGDLAEIEADLETGELKSAINEVIEKRQRNMLNDIADWWWYAEKPDPPSADSYAPDWNSMDLDRFDEDLEEVGPTHAAVSAGTIRYTDHRVGRNDPCPCGSGRKFKKCCGGH